MWNNPQLYPQMFPWLFLYGLGGIGGASTSISYKEHKRHFLMYHDKRFQMDMNFPFVAFSHEQVKTSTTQSFLLADQSRFSEISERLMKTDRTTLEELIKRMETGELVTPTSEKRRTASSSFKTFMLFLERCTALPQPKNSCETRYGPL